MKIDTCQVAIRQKNVAFFWSNLIVRTNLFVIDDSTYIFWALYAFLRMSQNIIKIVKGTFFVCYCFEQH